MEKEILHECKKSLSYGGLGTEKYVNIGKRHIPRTIIRATIISLEVVLSGLTVIVIIRTFFEQGLTDMLFPLHCSLLGYIKCSVYCVLLWKTNEIAQLFGFIQMIVQQRMSLFWQFFSLHRKKEWRKRFFSLSISIVNRVQCVSCITHHLFQMPFEWKANYKRNNRDILLFGCNSVFTIGLMLAIDIGFWCSVGGILGGATSHWWSVCEFLILINFHLIPSCKNVIFPCNLSTCRLPFDARRPVPFGFVMLAECFLVYNFLVISMMFQIMYINICTYLRPIIDDLAAIIDVQTMAIEQRITIKEKFLQFLELHSHLYEYPGAYFCISDHFRKWQVYCVFFSFKTGCWKGLNAS